MTNESLHIPLEQLSDLLDGRLSPGEAGTVTMHLSLCAACAERRDRLASLLDAARALPDEIEPPPALWRDVAERIGSPPRSTRPRWQLAAAAVLLVAVSSAVTALLVGRPRVLIVTEVPPVSASSNVLPPPVRSIDADYAGAIRDLNESLSENRARLDPATLAKVEASLRVIDSAIGELRRALAADPANLTLVDILAANYERKLELLRRANSMLSRT